MWEYANGMGVVTILSANFKRSTTAFEDSMKLREKETLSDIRGVMRWAMMRILVMIAAGRVLALGRRSRLSFSALVITELISGLQESRAQYSLKG
eukprot:CAMPEP_0197565078 /NCGR_PEP_ID=MMETSP1320-20131121/31500_1 /TAXON_ID=91990 /ORGANISM="Bolidomonas sp., Strain RCC2347" /LENGTH=94 /DNA_ID=CAMNT_0043127039 /DNA_START=316 /DNA_END=600 /DNA_ORIENTATION=+